MSIIITASTLQPPLCLELWDDIVSTSSGDAVEVELSVILPVKRAERQLKSMWTRWPLICAGNVLQDMSRILLWILADASCMIRPTVGSDCKAHIIMKINRLFDWYICLFCKGVPISLTAKKGASFLLWMFTLLKIFLLSITITALNIPWHVVSQLSAGVEKKMTPPKLSWTENSLFFLKNSVQCLWVELLSKAASNHITETY